MVQGDMFYILCALLALYVALVSCDCPADRKEQHHDEAKLHTDLLCAYDSLYRPVSDYKTTVNVSVRFTIKYISFDDLEETFVVQSWVGLFWEDEFLKWNPSDYSDIHETQMDSHEIWTPKLTLFNADASVYQTDQFYTTCLLKYNGTVMCDPLHAHAGVCQTSLRRWPYDEKNCTMYFGSWATTGEQVDYTFTKTEPVVLDKFQNGPGWKLLNVVPKRLPGRYAGLNISFPMLKYTFILKRISTGPAAIVIIPSVVIVTLTLVSLLLDVKDYIRIMLICFSLYGHFTFLSEVGYQIPKHSAETPIILLFIRDSMIVTLVGIIETILLMFLRRRIIPAPGWIVAVNKLVSRGPGKYVVFTEFDHSEAVNSKNVTDDLTNVNETKVCARVNWIQFANLLNSSLFIVSVFIYFVLIWVYIPRDDN